MMRPLPSPSTDLADRVRTVITVGSDLWAISFGPRFGLPITRSRVSIGAGEQAICGHDRSLTQEINGGEAKSTSTALSYDWWSHRRN